MAIFEKTIIRSKTTATFLFSDQIKYIEIPAKIDTPAPSPTVKKGVLTPPIETIGK